VRDAGGRPTSGPAAGAPDTEEHGKPVALWLVDLLAGATAAEMFAETLELWDVGGDLGGFDWSRLPDAKAGRCRGS